MQKLTENVYVQIAERGANAGCVVTTEGLVMVETPESPFEAREMRKQIDQMGKVRYLINTEPHHDHVMGNYYFEGIVIGHEGTRTEVLKISDELRKGTLRIGPPGTPPPPAGFGLRPPAITFSHILTLYLGNHTVKLTNLPGHTPFQTAVYIPEEKVVFTGDNVVNGGIPYINHVDPYAWLNSLKQLQELDIEHIVPGHGKVCGKDYLKEMTATIQSWIDAVKQAMGKRLSVEEAKKSINLVNYYHGEKRHLIEIQNMNIDNLYKVLKEVKAKDVPGS